jgi:hypothetical protein
MKAAIAEIIEYSPMFVALFIVFFVAIFLPLFSFSAIQKRKAARDRRLAQLRKSPDSRLLRLNV